VHLFYPEINERVSRSPIPRLSPVEAAKRSRPGPVGKAGRDGQGREAVK
jgi:hypothetical protein